MIFYLGWRVKYLTLIDANSGYHNLTLDMQYSYLTTYYCPFGWYRYIGLPFGVAPPGAKFQRKIDGLFHELNNVLGIANDISIASFNELGRDNDETVDKVLEICGSQPEAQQR